MFSVADLIFLKVNSTLFISENMSFFPFAYSFFFPTRPSGREIPVPPLIV